MTCSEHAQNEFISNLIAQIHGILCVISYILLILMNTQILLVQTIKKLFLPAEAKKTLS